MASVWLTYLLEHSEELPEGQLYYLRCNDLDKCTLMEKYDALRVYRLAAQGWQFWLRKRGVKKESFAGWEEGVGGPLPLGTFRDDLYYRLLDLILPRVAILQMGPEDRFYIKPPRPGWKAILEGWRQYITDPVKWGLFVEYTRSIEDLLWYEYPGSTQFNSRFQQRLAGFNEEELFDLRDAFKSPSTLLAMNDL